MARPGYIAQKTNSVDGSYDLKVLKWRPQIDKCRGGRAPTRWMDDLVKADPTVDVLHQIR